MRLDERLYKAFLEELDNLENFRISYTGTHPYVPLDRDDPDVQRLTEALAFFAARTRVAAVDHVFALQRRLFSQYFPFLISPLPAMGILLAKPTGQFVESLVLPAGTEFVVTPQKGGSAFFTTLRELRITPLTLADVKMVLLPGRGFRLLLHFRAPYQRNDEVDWLSLHINHLNDYLASLFVFRSLRECLKGVMVVFEDEVTELSRGPSCEAVFGSALLEPEGVTEETPHPIQRERQFFHFPHQDLFLNVRVPKPPRNWQRFTLCLDLSPRWPRNLVLNRDIFQLLAVPVINCRRSMAEPIVCDGTQEGYSIRHANQEFGFRLYSVLGVYEVMKNRMEPLQPGILAGGTGTYEIENGGEGQKGRKPRLNLHFPEAFLGPRTVAVDAIWVQPWFSDRLRQRHQIVPYSRSAAGIRWEWLGDTVPQVDNGYLDDMEGIVQLITLTNKASLNFADLRELLTSMGIGKQPPFQRAMQNVVGLRVEEAPHQRGTGQGLLKHVYILLVKSLDATILPLMEVFSEHVGRVLDAWIPDVSVEVRLELLR